MPVHIPVTGIESALKKGGNTNASYRIESVGLLTRVTGAAMKSGRIEVGGQKLGGETFFAGLVARQKNTRSSIDRIYQF